MDEKGANTFPFHNLPPELKKTPLKVFPYWIKEKSVANLANRDICDKTQNLKSVLPPYHNYVYTLDAQNIFYTFSYKSK